MPAPRGISASTVADLLLTEHDGLAVLPGTAFRAAGENHPRLPLTAPAPVPVLDCARPRARLVRWVQSVMDQHHPES